MIGRPLERDSRSQYAVHRFRKGFAIGEAHSDVVEPGRAGRWRRATLGLPGVEPDVVVIAAGGDERRLVAHPSLLLEAEHVTPEAERAVEVGHLQMDMADVESGVDRRSWDRWPP